MVKLQALDARLKVSARVKSRVASPFAFSTIIII